MIKMILYFIALALFVLGSLAVPTPVNNDFSLRIAIGQQPATDIEHPFVVLLYYYERFVCAGTLLTLKHVVTSAHCVFVYENPLPFAKFKVVAGTNERTEALPVDAIDVIEINIHPNYNPTNKEENKIMHFDIAILTIPEIISNPKIGILPYLEPFVLTKPLTLYGWGSIRPGPELSKELLETKLNIISEAECRNIYNGKDLINTNQICAWTPTKKGSICYGDSGGPLVGENIYGERILVGIASWGTHCGRKEKSDVFTKVQGYLAWITSVIDW